MYEFKRSIISFDVPAGVHPQDFDCYTLSVELSSTGSGGKWLMADNGRRCRDIRNRCISIMRAVKPDGHFWSIPYAGPHPQSPQFSDGAIPSPTHWTTDPTLLIFTARYACRRQRAVI